MRIHGHFLCWNEEKLVPYFLRHYESICDVIHIYDNSSSDTSLLLLRKSPKVVIHEFDTNNEFNEAIQIQLKSECWKKSRGNCDWVIVGDFDEFVYHPNLHTKLEQLDKANIAAVQLYAYQMVGLSFPSTRLQIYDEINMGARLPLYDKVQLFNPNKVDNIKYAPGCHHAVIDATGSILLTEEILLLHFKMLGIEYLSSRNEILNKRRNAEMVEKKYGVQYEKTDQSVLIEEITEIWKNSVSAIIR